MLLSRYTYHFANLFKFKPVPVTQTIAKKKLKPKVVAKNDILLVNEFELTDLSQIQEPVSG